MEGPLRDEIFRKPVGIFQYLEGSGDDITRSAKMPHHEDTTPAPTINQPSTSPIADRTIHVAPPADEDTNGSIQGDEDDADEPTYCYCNEVSYGEMVACDADECPREWFHLECVGLKVAPPSRGELLQEKLDRSEITNRVLAKWYCEDCKERLKIGGKGLNDE
jgi:hypothetical protein